MLKQMSLYHCSNQ